MQMTSFIVCPHSIAVHALYRQPATNFVPSSTVSWKRSKASYGARSPQGILQNGQRTPKILEMSSAWFTHTVRVRGSPSGFWNQIRKPKLEPQTPSNFFAPKHTHFSKPGALSTLGRPTPTPLRHSPEPHREALTGGSQGAKAYAKISILIARKMQTVHA